MVHGTGTGLLFTRWLSSMLPLLVDSLFATIPTVCRLAQPYQPVSVFIRPVTARLGVLRPLALPPDSRFSISVD